MFILNRIEVAIPTVKSISILSVCLGLSTCVFICGLHPKSSADELPRSEFPIAASKKGLQVEDIKDAIGLGVKHATFNVVLTGLLLPLEKVSNRSEFSVQGEFGEYGINEPAILALDQKIRSLSDAGVFVYLILLNRGGKPIDLPLSHPDYDPTSPNGYSAFHVDTPESRDKLQCIVKFLAKRYSRESDATLATHGRVVGYIVGNEVNSHWWWHNRGTVDLERFVKGYADEFAVITRAIERESKWARTYVSLDHHWTSSIQPKQPGRCFGSRAFLESFAKECKDREDLAWHVAFHPYPQNLFEPAFWRDNQATDDDQSPKVTFRNLNVLRDFLRRPEMLYRGQPRSIILSEQGFHCKKGAEGETLQAAAYCYAYALVEATEGIDALILHRHIDHPNEGGLRVGLYANNDKVRGRVAEPTNARLIQSCFRAADTADRDRVFQFALPIVGLREWPSKPAN